MKHFYIFFIMLFSITFCNAQIDTDNDGITDSDEITLGTSPTNPDSDSDFIFDGTEHGVTTPPIATNISAGNFIADSDSSTTTNPLSADTDNGGMIDGAEDFNRNGRLDPLELNPNLSADDGNVDFDSDGIPNNSDNCKFVFNTAQEDMDSDGIGDFCDCSVSSTNPSEKPASSVILKADPNNSAASSPITIYAISNSPISTYSWTKNNISVTNTTYKYTDNFIAGDIIKCTVTSSVSCSANTNQGNTITISSTLGLDNSQFKTIRIFPNPTSEFITISTDLKIIQNEIFDFSGKLLLKTSDKKINISGFPKGTYFLKVGIENKTISQKIIKQ